MEFPGNFIGIQNTANTNHLSGVHSLYEVGQGISDGTWPTNYKINQSLRFNGTSNYLTRTPSSLGNRRTFTFSFWHKKSADDAEAFFNTIINTSKYPLTRLSNTNATEIAKVLENSYRAMNLSLIHISEPTRLRRISYAVFCLKKKKQEKKQKIKH